MPGPICRKGAWNKQVCSLDRFLVRCANGNRDTKLNITMDDEDPDSYLLKAMSPLYHKCAKVTGKPSRLESQHIC